jgi:hypothetical protein
LQQIKNANLVIVVNDNAAFVFTNYWWFGGAPYQLFALTKGYEKFLDFGKAVIESNPSSRRSIYDSAVHGMKKGIKDIHCTTGNV